MTKQEAIEYAKEQKEIFGGTHKEFLDVAIQALKESIVREDDGK